MSEPKEIIDDWVAKNAYPVASELVTAFSAAGHVIVTREDLESILVTMNHARTFVDSRERIKRPEGIDLYDEDVAKLRAMIGEKPC